jgi:bifunctional non-homologous end joining protein LigD
VPGRVLFPKTGFTTDDLVSVYEQLAPVILPHLAARPLTLKRFPTDIHGEAFWEKDAPNFTPSWIRRVPVPRKHENSIIHYISLTTARALRWAASIGCIEIHSFLHRYPYITSPSVIAFDLDPGPGTNLVDCCAVAIEVRDWFRRWKLQCFSKTSGSKGIQVYVPLNTPSSYEATQAVARKVAEDLAQRHPDKIIASMARAERTGKIFIDWSQNAEHKTTVSVYSVRAKQEEPFVSMPITWKEIQQTLKTRRTQNLVFPPNEAIQRVRKLGDIFGPVLTLQQQIPEKLASELQLFPEPPPQPLRIPEPRAATPTLPRSSGQGGRRLFVVHRRGSTFELAIEHRDQFRLYELPKIPARKSEAAQYPGIGMRPLAYLTDESPQSGQVWDLGTYEIVEGSLDRARASIYFSGQRMSGPWRLAREEDTWNLTNIGGRLVPGLPNTRSMLSRFLPTQRRTRNHAA